MLRAGDCDARGAEPCGADVPGVAAGAIWRGAAAAECMAGGTRDAGTACDFSGAISFGLTATTLVGLMAPGFGASRSGVVDSSAAFGAGTVAGVGFVSVLLVIGGGA